MFLRRSPVCLLLSGAVLGMIIMLMIQNLLSPFQSSTAKLAVQGSIHQMAVQGGIRQVRVKSERQMDHLKVAKTRDENPSRQINPGVITKDDIFGGNPRILCWVMTSQETLDTRAVHVKRTWGKRCDVLLFASDYQNKTFGTMDINPGKGRGKLPEKTIQALDYIYNNHMMDADWFIKSDDDTYVIVENLRYFLASKNTSEAVYYGHHFVGLGGYPSGGAGYVLSKEALRRFGDRKVEDKYCTSYNTDAEDTMMGRCMRYLRVPIGETHDSQNKSTFHCFHPDKHIEGHYHKWYESFDSHGAKHGMEFMSDYPVSFHYVKPHQLYTMEYFLYHVKLYDGLRKK